MVTLTVFWPLLFAGRAVHLPPPRDALQHRTLPAAHDGQGVSCGGVQGVSFTSILRGGGGGGLCGFTRFGRPGKSKFVHENHGKSVLYMNKTKRYSAYGLKTWKLIKLQHCKVQAWKTLEINFWSRIALENQICV